MKLELHEIAGYLPYGIAFDHFDYEREIRSVCEFASLNIDEITITNSDYEFTYSISEVKPILRPMSDLSKEITHNGETFVPVRWFEIGDGENQSLEFDHGNIKIIQLLKVIAKYNTYHDVMHLPFGIVKKLLEWHFDIHNLIGRGLAISIHDLPPTEKPSLKTT